MSVESLLAETTILLSPLQANRYTAPTWPLRLATNLPVLPSHTLTLLSRPALAIHRPSGEKAECETGFWCPVSRATGFFGVGVGRVEVN